MLMLKEIKLYKEKAGAGITTDSAFSVHLTCLHPQVSKFVPEREAAKFIFRKNY